MATSLLLALPWPPSVNRVWRRVGSRTLLSAEGREYRRQVAVRWVAAGRPVAPPGRLAVAIHAWPPDYRTRDLDNLPKAVLDGLTACGTWADDALIDCLTIERREQVRGGRIEVEVRSIGEDRCGSCGAHRAVVMA